MQNSPASEPELSLKLGDFISYAVQRLKTANIENAETDARILIAHGLALDRAELYSQTDRMLSRRETMRLTVFIECRAKHEPVARIMGQREFWSLPFGMNEATLEPRPDTETVVATALRLLGGRHNENLRLLDVGTGTGCILLSLLHDLPNATGIGTDKASRAVEQAKLNATKLDLNNRAAFQTGHWTDGITELFDVVVSNPPYIPSGDIAGLMPEVRDFDPMTALDGGPDGLAPYRTLIPRLPMLLKPKGLAVFECGIDQASSVSTLFRASGFKTVSTHCDLAGIERCVAARVE